MYRYRVYGLSVHSTYEIPNLPPEDASSEPDVTISPGHVDPVPEAVEGTGIRRILGKREKCRITYDGVGTFLVESGESVIFNSESDEYTDRVLFRKLIKNEIMGIALYQRGYLVLHASAVSIEGTAVVFLGPRGAGKSTAAAAFNAAGYTVLEDDVVAIELADEGPRVLPGVPQIRLRPDTAKQFDVSTASGDRAGDEQTKHRQTVTTTSNPVPLGACYIISEGQRVELEAITGGDRFIHLISHTYTKGLLSETEMTEDHFQQCAAVVKAAKFRRLYRTADLDTLPEVVEVVVDDIDGKKCR